MVVPDNALIGGDSIPSDAPELTALRRTQRRNHPLAENQRPNSIVIPEESQHLEIDKVEKRYTSNVRTSENKDIYKPKFRNTTTSQSNTRKKLNPNAIYVPQYFDSMGKDKPVVKKEPPPEYNLHLKQQEQVKQQKEQRAIGEIMIEE